MWPPPGSGYLEATLSRLVASDALRRVACVIPILVLAYILSSQIVAGNMRTVLIIFLLLVLGALSLRIERGVVALMIFLPFMGFLRRSIYVFNPWVEFDPILIVSDVVVIFMFSYLLIFRREALFNAFRKSRLVRYATFLLLVFSFQIFNPLQGNVLAGLAGAKFYLIPLLWFYFGLLSDGKTVVRLFYAFAAVAIVVGIYGIFQAHVGFQGFEEYWTRSVHFGSLSIRGHIRPFSTFNSPEEFSRYLQISSLVLLALFWRKKSLLHLAATLTVLYSLLLVAFRSSLFGFILSLLAFLGLSTSGKKWRWHRPVVMAILGILVLANFSLPDLEMTEGPGVNDFLEHSMAGVRDPTRNPTLRFRLELWKHLLTRVIIRNPLGYGLGVGSLPSPRFGGPVEATESSLFSVFVGSGVAGGVLLLLVLFQFFTQAMRLYSEGTNPFVHRLIIALGAGLALTLLFGQNLTLYTVAPFFWFLIGRVAGEHTILKSETEVLKHDRK